eukprot:TRINITY_DN352_c2_g1_i1.p1 TRINITY_DN352_c2_g1~~TRINITY_DN352_c2_g1_i1.p1  ORF type:complete len:204 (+),score=59.61 TRINITY_DN352_c2_g1_i1:72-683(+)
MTDFLIGITGKDFVLVCADTTVSRSIYTYKDTEDKIHEFPDRRLFAVSGSKGDRDYFAEYLRRNADLHRFRHGYPLSCKALAAFARNELAKAIRSSPLQVNGILAGFDEKEGPTLHYMDYLGSYASGKFFVDGYGSYFAYSVLDRFHHQDMNVEEALDLVRKVIQEVSKRLVLHLQNFRVKIVDANGTRVLLDMALAPQTFRA